jgi:nucleotidyltransferase substrate binding protein (TIGR01987 family)
MNPPPISLHALRKALDALASARRYWLDEPPESGRKPHLRAGVVQSFEFSYELAVRSLRRVLMERAAVAPQVADLSFNDLLRAGADAGLLDDALGWRRWRELRNRTSHAYDEGQAQSIAESTADFLPEALSLLQRLEGALAR